MLHVNLTPSKTKTGKSQEASNGFVSFSIRPKTSAPVGTRLENFADIYFDFNDPIRTNTTYLIWHQSENCADAEKLVLE